MNILVYITLGLLAFYFYLRHRSRSPKKGKEIPSPPGWPIAGNAFEMNKGKNYNTFHDIAEKYGDIFKLNVFGKSHVILNKMELIRTAFNGNPYNKYMNDRVATFVGEYVLFKCSGVILKTKAFGSDHGAVRKAFTKGMHVYGEGRREFEDNIQSELVNLIGRMKQLEGKEFDLVSILKRSLTNVISIILGGHDIKDDDADVNVFWDFDTSAAGLFRPHMDAVLRTFPFLRFVPGTPFKQLFDKAEESTKTVVRRYVTEKRATYTPGKIRGFVDFMLKEQLEARSEGREPLFNDERIHALTLETVGAGILTTLSVLSSTFLCLMNYPEYQLKIQEELDRVIGRNRLPTLSDKQSCVFTEAVCMEVQRYITAVPLSVVHYCEPNIEFEGYNIPANSVIMPNLWYVHHDKNVWGDPWNFRPERFLDKNGELLPNDHILRKSWMAFSTGRRQCIGESLARSRIFLYITYLLQRWNFEMFPVVSCDPRLEDNFDEDVTVRPKPYLCKIVPRK